MSNELTFDTIDPKRRDLIMLGLAIALFAACFDGTVTTTCGPVIGNHFNATDLLPWLTIGYLLFETVTIPLSGKLSDLYGRKKLLIIGLVLFGAASFLASVAWNMEMVIFARALQGAGGGVLIPVATAAVSDLYPPETRGKVQGALGALYGVGMGLGPIIGGAFADLGVVGPFQGWQLAFLINIPVVLFVIYLCRHEFPNIASDEKPSIDYLGVCIVSATLILVVIYFQLLGKSFDVISVPSVAMILAVVILINVFGYVENRAKEPIMAMHMFNNPTVVSACTLLFIGGFCLVSDELFMGMYLQKIAGFSPMEAGMFILIMVAGMIIASTVSGMLLNKMGCKFWIVCGAIGSFLGFFLFSLIDTNFNIVLFSVSEFLFGLGVGCQLSSLMTAVQNSCEHKEVGMTTSAVNLFRNIGATVGTSVLTLIVNANIYEEALDKGLPQSMAELGIGILDKLGQGMDAVIKTVFTDAVATAFGIVSVMLLIGLIIALRFKIVTIEQSKKMADYEKDLTKDNPNH